MAVTFIVEDGTGVANANSLSTVEYADQYFLDRPWGGDWAGFTADGKKQNLVGATWILATMLDWRGWPLDYEQPLPFPRAGLADRNGFWYPTNQIPREVLYAVCELALVLGKTPDRYTSEPGALGVTGVSLAGVIDVDMNKAPGISQVLPVIPDNILALIGHLAGPTSGAGSGNSFLPKERRL